MPTEEVRCGVKGKTEVLRSRLRGCGHVRRGKGGRVIMSFEEHLMWRWKEGDRGEDQRETWKRCLLRGYK